MGMRLLAPDLLNYGSTRSNYPLPTPQMCSSVAPSNPFIPLLFVTSLENPQDSGSPSCFGRVLPTARAAGRFPACAAPLSPLGDAREPEKRRSDALGVSKEHKSCSFLAFFWGVRQFENADCFCGITKFETGGDSVAAQFSKATQVFVVFLSP